MNMDTEEMRLILTALTKVCNDLHCKIIDPWASEDRKAEFEKELDRYQAVRKKVLWEE